MFAFHFVFNEILPVIWQPSVPMSERDILRLTDEKQGKQVPHEDVFLSFFSFSQTGTHEDVLLFFLSSCLFFLSLK